MRGTHELGCGWRDLSGHRNKLTVQGAQTERGALSEEKHTVNGLAVSSKPTREQLT